MADSSSRNPFAAFGHRLIEAVWKLGFVCRFFAAILRDSGASLRRFPDGININELTVQLNKPYSRLSSQLLEMEFKGLVKCLPGGVYKAVR